MAAITNGELVNLIKHKGIQDAWKLLSGKEGLKSSKETLLKDLDKLFKRFQHLNKSKSRVKGKENLDRFTQSAYMYPVPKEPSGNCSNSLSKKSTSDTLLPSGSGSSFLMENVAKNLAGELIELQDEKKKIEEELNLTIEEKDELNESLEKSEITIEGQKKHLKRVSNREAYWRGKCQKLETFEADKAYTEEDMNILQMSIETLQTENREKIQMIDELNERILEYEIQINELNKINSAQVYDEKSKTYSFDLHACVYSLLDNHVPFENVSNVINAVFKLVNVKPNKLPSVSTIHNW